MFKSKAKQITDFFLATAEDIQEETWNLGGEKETVEPDGSQLAAMADERRVLVTAGNLAVINGLHNSTFAHVSRKQYLHWALLAHDVHNFATAVCNYFREIAIQSFHDNRGICTGGFQHYATGHDDV